MSIRPMRGVILLASLLVVGLAAAPSALAGSGDLTFADCLSIGVSSECGEVGSLPMATGVGVSPDGNQVYVTSAAGEGITTLDRGPDGALTFNSCLGARPMSPAGCDDLPFEVAVAGVTFGDLAVDPGGAAVFVNSSSLSPSAAWSLARAPDGSLSFAACYDTSQGGDANCADGDFALNDPRGIAVSPDGEHLYVAEHSNGSVYSLDIANDLSLSLDRCLGEGPHCTGAPPDTGRRATGVAASPGGSSVYVTGSRAEGPLGQGTLQIFGRPSGMFSFLGCFNACSGQDSLDQADGIAVSGDDENVYVASGHPTGGDDSVTVFDRAADGSLADAGCLALDDHDGCSVPPSSGALDGVRHIAVSPDGASVYAAGPTAITNFRRRADGSLKFVGCVADQGAFGCTDPAPVRLEEIRGLALSPDGTSLYATSLNSIVHFDREPVDTTAPGLVLDAKPKQELGGPIVVEGGCDEDCSLAASGTLKLSGEPGELKLKGAKGKTSAGRDLKLKLKLSRAAAGKVKKAGAKGGRASVKVVATDADGNATTKRTTIALKARG